MRFKTKKEFIEAVMSGKKFKLNGSVFSYDEQEENPFRIDKFALKNAWIYITNNDFIEVSTEPETESWAQFRYYDNDSEQWVLSDMFKTLDDFIEYFDDFSHHHEIEGTRIDLPKIES